jgi:hypothetical protein
MKQVKKQQTTKGDEIQERAYKDNKGSCVTMKLNFLRYSKGSIHVM